MTSQIIVVENAADWKYDVPDCTVITANDYVAGEEYLKAKHIQVINLCRGYKYLSLGYYCSLLAEARRHRVIPSVKTIVELGSKTMYGLDVENLDGVLKRTLAKRRQAASGESFELDILFGRCEVEGLAELARQIFETFPCPLLRVEFQHGGSWRINSVRPLSLKRLDNMQQPLFAAALDSYRKKRWRSPKTRSVLPYDMAILYNPEDPLPPSDKRALDNFVKAGKFLGVDVEVIGKKDYARLAEYDALFIRDTTQIAHYTYRFSKKAENEGMVVIDDPASILKCTNKVYLAELLRANKVPTPKTMIVEKGGLERIEEEFAYPVVLKVPEGSFSRGVFKAGDHDELKEVARKLLKESELILAQEYMYTEFDWRIGVLNRRPLFACQYFMSKKHWQIVKYGPSGRFEEGAFKAWHVDDAPREVVAAALAAANLIGDGLYGVDVKQAGDRVCVIEVNDNPNIEAGVEDAVLKDELYRMIMREFVYRLERRRTLETS
jgi:glutathione synthase/RimK-type ligase-like ATP-grasp enzyme